MNLQYSLPIVFATSLFLGCGGNSSSDDNNESSANGSSSSFVAIECGSVEEDEFCDQRYGQAYKFKAFGTQVWMVENLNAGTIVPGMAATDKQSDDSRLEKYCYNDSTPLCKESGAFYQWYEAVGLSSGCLETFGMKGKKCPELLPAEGHVQGACPVGWHIPRESEWLSLVTYLGAKDGSASPVGSKVKLYTGEFNAQRWDDGLYNDSNSSGFSAFPSGYRGPDGGYDNRFQSTSFWSIGYSNEPFTRGLGEDRSDFLGNMGDPAYGHNIRCVRNEPATTSFSSSSAGISYGKITDTRDKKSYKTIEIGTQTWLAENLNYESKTGTSKCYEDSDKNCSIYGRLYTWSAAMGLDAEYDSTQWTGDSSNWQGICPEGWRIPSIDDWIKLRSFADRSIDGALNQNSAMALKSDSLWNSQFGSGNAEMSIGFNGLPAGSFWNASDSDFIYEDIGGSTVWWSTEQDIVNSYGLNHDGLKSVLGLHLALGDDQLMIDDIDKVNGNSVRCIKVK